MTKLLSFLLLLLSGMANAQELNCTVTINAQKVGATNQKVFKTLQTSLNEFINKTNWTGEVYKPNEKINCSMSINVETFEADQVTATLQIQSSRTAFNSSYATPVFNFNDKNFNFRYTEFELLNFNPQTFDSNLISVIAFYAYIIIGMDQDTFSKNGGSVPFEIAQNVANVAQGSGYKGWSQNDGNQNRYFLITDMLSATFFPFRDAMFQYHFFGMDNMYRDSKIAKQKIILALAELKEIHDLRPNSLLMRVFFDTKTDEIVSVFSGGPKINMDDMIDNLNRISPLNSGKWINIKN